MAIDLSIHSMYSVITNDCQFPPARHNQEAQEADEDVSPRRTDGTVTCNLNS